MTQGRSIFSKAESFLQGVQIYVDAAGPAGLMRAIQGKLAGTVTNVRVKRKECLHPFTLRVPTSDVPTCWQVFVHKEYEFSVGRQPEVIIDAGANIGLASIYFANRFPDTKIIAIEPEQSNFELLRENVSPYANIHPLQAALWNRNEDIDLLDPGLGKWGFMTGSCDVADQLPANARHRVPGMTVDRVMRDYGLAQVDILKIDIEGAEREVFSDASLWIDKVDGMIVELHEHMKKGCEQSFERGATGFGNRWFQGENVFLGRGRCIMRPPG